MNLRVGNIVAYNNPQAGKLKYHLCMQPCDDFDVACFLFINSKSGYAADCAFPEADFPCLMPSPTGMSVVSCSQVVRATARQLGLFQAEILGDCSPAVATKLYQFVTPLKTLTKGEKALVLAALQQIGGY